MLETKSNMFYPGRWLRTCPQSFWQKRVGNRPTLGKAAGWGNEGRDKPPLARIRLLVLLVCLVCGLPNSMRAQPARKPIRVQAPTFRPGQFDGVFYGDPASQLKGEKPSTLGGSSVESTASTKADTAGNDVSRGDQSGSMVWKDLISPASLEDLVKGSKLRLDRIVSTVAAFKGGGFAEARTEFSLQAVLFAIIESYPGEVRWKSSAAVARERFARVAANTKIGSDQVFQEAKARLLDLTELIGGSALSDHAKSEIEWSSLIDRVPLMQLLDWAHEKNLTKLVASESEFNDNLDAVERYAQLIAVLGRVALSEDMPDASDSDYARYATAMSALSQQIVAAAQTGNADLARGATAQIGQTCTSCHDNFR